MSRVIAYAVCILSTGLIYFDDLNLSFKYRQSNEADESTTLLVSETQAINMLKLISDF